MCGIPGTRVCAQHSGLQAGCCLSLSRPGKANDYTQLPGRPHNCIGLFCSCWNLPWSPCSPHPGSSSTVSSASVLLTSCSRAAHRLPWPLALLCPRHHPATGVCPPHCHAVVSGVGHRLCLNLKQLLQVVCPGAVVKQGQHAPP